MAVNESDYNQALSPVERKALLQDLLGEATCMNFQIGSETIHVRRYEHEAFLVVLEAKARNVYAEFMFDKDGRQTAAREQDKNGEVHPYATISVDTHLNRIETHHRSPLAA